MADKASFTLESARVKVEELRAEVHRRGVQGMDATIDATLITLFAPGNNNHILMEAVPGVGKTLLARTIAEACDMDFSRIQMTPQTMPEDITGDESPVFDDRGNMTGEFSFRKGPIFARGIVLTDEINRTSPRTTSAVLEPMEELQVTTKRSGTIKLEPPFNVFATQNPLDQTTGGGTYAMSEAQKDRFMMKINVPYISDEETLRVLEAEDSNLQARGLDIAGQTHDEAVEALSARSSIRKVISAEDILEIRELVDGGIFISSELRQIIVEFTNLTRPNEARLVAQGNIVVGGSTRFPIYLQRAIKTRAFLEGRNFVVPQDIVQLAPFVLGHRIGYNRDVDLSKRSEILDRTLDEILGQVFIARL
ncbi:MAG: hypothetical protein A3F94_00320 [Candidatus Spechtbacteria bacterium RIFCSPLOWO2_12_FULL_38_22]|uniref:AAA+ ATPase domain-containing protein n=1 Tax=Candidatus Spechtbacteria bacterium RIFCSPLOWO2_12_FULL_38_22 TaxID=1802165 RepID=A0A1G2HH46_9BACT|nr:MAG: hypothetical protein A2728_03010 [Candidatus Spechtbacteria bacterium RIFCSPHIGHO2_01_FULL_38_11]OGZ58963.1 MAG: hypothetical protein A3E58_01325 [Candidatus Spechtbacteria bacterium RIFCSPHIGHO2_12_FULL_38_30]OGZ60694.1 MAG: hypothetical protein A3A00_02065 [Candidatus Spechtbacteria bacterium RIFCSPLOWO2_01_FULL_38_20]OGZ61571.1 MAG: hypothetical protein A3F94_00320 [Candidatus Spechtbacteria bacterium RIFCSPLOWO2_12_FULL_38_22]